MMIGWSLESMWSLAWVLGMRYAPKANDKQLSNAIIDAIFDFADSPRGLTALIARAKPRKAAIVIAHEHDLFLIPLEIIENSTEVSSDVGNGPRLHRPRLSD